MVFNANRFISIIIHQFLNGEFSLNKVPIKIATFSSSLILNTTKVYRLSSIRYYHPRYNFFIIKSLEVSDKTLRLENVSRKLKK